MGGKVTKVIYSVYCEDCGTTKYFNGESPLEECPDDATHTVTADSFEVVDAVSSVILVGEDAKYYELYIDAAGVISKREII